VPLKRDIRNWDLEIFWKSPSRVTPKGRLRGKRPMGR